MLGPGLGGPWPLEVLDSAARLPSRSDRAARGAGAETASRGCGEDDLRVALDEDALRLPRVGISGRRGPSRVGGLARLAGRPPGSLGALLEPQDGLPVASFAAWIEVLSTGGGATTSAPAPAKSVHEPSKTHDYSLDPNAGIRIRWAPETGTRGQAPAYGDLSGGPACPRPPRGRGPQTANFCIRSHARVTYSPRSGQAPASQQA